MEKGLIVALKSRFDTIAHVDEESGIEFWYARELQKELGYQRWENFMIAIERAETACEKSKIECHNHFREVTKMVIIGSSAERGIIDIKLTRYACYLIAQNGDPRKEEIAFAQSYFASMILNDEVSANSIMKRATKHYTVVIKPKE